MVIYCYFIIYVLVSTTSMRGSFQVCERPGGISADQPWLPLFLRARRCPKSRISAENKLMTADNLVEEQKKQRGRPFVKGQSGNPAGRPRRPRSDAANAVQSALEGEAEALGSKAVELALSGDTAALRLCLDRLMPSRRDRVVPLALPPVRGAGDLTAAMAAIMAAAARGKISPREGIGLAKLIDVFLRAIDTHDFDRRLRVLEEDAGLGR
jgi:hypothetical protein